MKKQSKFKSRLSIGPKDVPIRPFVLWFFAAFMCATLLGAVILAWLPFSIPHQASAFVVTFTATVLAAYVASRLFFGKYRRVFTLSEYKKIFWAAVVVSTAPQVVVLAALLALMKMSAGELLVVVASASIFGILLMGIIVGIAFRIAVNALPA